jgi:molecular chaperone DnaJ
VRFSTGGAAGPDLEDLLGGMFGSGGGYGGYGAPRGPRHGQDVNATTTLGFREAVAGATVTLRKPDGGTITTRVPPGVRDGQRIRLRGKGGAGDEGAPAGDLFITVNVTPHPVFGRKGDDLTVTVPVTFDEAALGAQIDVPTLDGSVRVKVPAGTPSGRTLRVKGRGVTNGSSTGDLRVTVQVVVPQKLTDEARAAVEAYAAATKGEDPRADLMARARA